MLDSKEASPADRQRDVGHAAPGARDPAVVYRDGVLQGSDDGAGAPRSGRHRRLDPALLPLGSVVEIDSRIRATTASTRSSIPGLEVQGPELDIYMWSCHEALKFGRKPIRLTVLRLGWNRARPRPAS